MNLPQNRKIERFRSQFSSLRFVLSTIPPVHRNTGPSFTCHSSRVTPGRLFEARRVYRRFGPCALLLYGVQLHSALHSERSAIRTPRSALRWASSRPGADISRIPVSHRPFYTSHSAHCLINICL